MWNVLSHITHTLSLSVSQFFSMKPTLKKVSKYENKFAKLQKKAAEFNFRNQLKQVKKKEFTLEEEDKEVRMIVFNHVLASKTKLFLFSVILFFGFSSPVSKIQIFFFLFGFVKRWEQVFLRKSWNFTSALILQFLLITSHRSLSLFFTCLILRSFCKFSYWYIRWRFFCVLQGTLIFLTHTATRRA